MTASSAVAVDPSACRKSPESSSERRISVLIADGQNLFRSGLARLLSEDDRLLVAGLSDGGDDIPAMCLAMSIDVVISDVQVNGRNAIELTRTISTISPQTRVIILADRADWRVMPALLAGAAGFLLKDTEPEAICSAVVSAHSGEQVLCREATQWLMHKAPGNRLTRRESEILTLLGRGATNSEIGSLLQLGDKTVRNYVSRLYRKLAVRSRAQMTAAAANADLIDAYVDNGNHSFVAVSDFEARDS